MQNHADDLSVYFKRMAEHWPSTLVARERINEFTGGILTPGRIANLDSMGQGPRNRIRIGRKIAYPVADLVEWLAERAQQV